MINGEYGLDVVGSRSRLRRICHFQAGDPKGLIQGKSDSSMPDRTDTTDPLHYLLGIPGVMVL